MEAHARHAHRAELAAQQLRAGQIELGQIAVLRAHAMPQRALPLRRAQVALLELGALEARVVGVGAAQIEPLDRHAVEIDRAQPDRLRGEPGDRATGELVVGDQPLELDSRLDDASVGACVTHADEDTPSHGPRAVERRRCACSCVARGLAHHLEDARLDLLDARPSSPARQPAQPAVAWLRAPRAPSEWPLCSTSCSTSWASASCSSVNGIAPSNVPRAMRGRAGPGRRG